MVALGNGKSLGVEWGVASANSAPAKGNEGSSGGIGPVTAKTKLRSPCASRPNDLTIAPAPSSTYGIVPKEKTRKGLAECCQPLNIRNPSDDVLMLENG